MKQIVILSGKGGTGKTSVAAALAHLAANGQDQRRTVLVDADVDASNLELVLSPRVLEKHEFKGGHVAVIDAQACEGCGLCAELCRFDAIAELSRSNYYAQSGPLSAFWPPDSSPDRAKLDLLRLDGGYIVDPIACEGCGLCHHQCPSGAIRMEEQVAGEWYRSDTRLGGGPLFHAALWPGQENSGKLVTLVKQQGRLLALDEDRDLVLVDGPPGIGCPVISAAAGADLALIVAEPTAAGIHDMERALATTAHFGVPALVCINKADLHPDGAAEIETYCAARGLPVVGQLPFDTIVTAAMVQGQPVTAFAPESPISAALRAVWQRVLEEVQP